MTQLGQEYGSNIVEHRSWRVQMITSTVCQRVCGQMTFLVRTAWRWSLRYCTSPFSRPITASLHPSQVGTVWINCWMVRDLNMPFGGVKASGVGRESAEVQAVLHPRVLHAKLLVVFCRTRSTFTPRPRPSAPASLSSASHFLDFLFHLRSGTRNLASSGTGRRSAFEWQYYCRWG